MDISELWYDLPSDLIAQYPAQPRDSSRLMVVERKTRKLRDMRFSDIIQLLKKGDVLVFNETRVFPARVFGIKDTGGKVEFLLLKNIDTFEWEALTKPGIKVNEHINFPGFKGVVVQRNGKVSVVKFSINYLSLLRKLEKIGTTPLPPYIKSVANSKVIKRQYQTVYAKVIGSSAAPTAGLHFTRRLLAKIKKKGVEIEFVTLHVGLGTFEPVKEKVLEKHDIHEEYFEIKKSTIDRLNRAKRMGRRIIAVGTTTTRVLETLSKENSQLNQVSKGMTKLFIYPGFKFKFVDGIITNFHLPKSTLLALVFAFAGKNLIKKAYTKAVDEKYRFYSFGDATFIY